MRKRQPDRPVNRKAIGEYFRNKVWTPNKNNSARNEEGRSITADERRVKYLPPHLRRNTRARQVHSQPIQGRQQAKFEHIPRRQQLPARGLRKCHLLRGTASIWPPFIMALTVLRNFRNSWNALPAICLGRLAPCKQLEAAPKPIKPQSVFFSEDEVRQSLGHSRFSHHVLRYADEGQALQVFQAYNLGHVDNDSTQFWYTNSKGNHCAAKVTRCWVPGRPIDQEEQPRPRRDVLRQTGRRGTFDPGVVRGAFDTTKPE